ncbi:MAG: trehalose-phosphatase [Oligoflexia bacterium]|nr:trehalose-phosphatase [Oligoflexia bacterium]
MKYIFSNSSIDKLKRIIQKKVLYGFDFDGTLVKITKIPTAAKIMPQTDLLLKKLSQFSLTSVISGRGLKDLNKKLIFKPQFIIGNHGLEGLRETKKILKQCKKTCNRWKKDLYLLNKKFHLDIEDKTYSLSLHYRQARNKMAAKAEILRVVKKFKPQPRIILGKSVINIIPSEKVNKGYAVMKLLNKTRSNYLLYVGDDYTDEDVFYIKNKKIVKIRVGFKKNSKAAYFLKTQSEINRLLKLLIKLEGADKN